MKFEKALDIQRKVEDLIINLNSISEQKHLNQYRIICMRSYNSKARAYARIWAFPEIWQKALDIGTFYVIEVLSEHFDKLNSDKQEQVLIHELLHIPKTFSGALVNHNNPHKPITNETVFKLWRKYKDLKTQK